MVQKFDGEYTRDLDLPDDHTNIVEKRAKERDSKRIKADQWQALLGVLHLRLDREME